ncbi:MAG TPA: lipocalin-like domain-containing protein [Rhizomicrobium sp.]|jgi:predicted secreted hydrolase|nr:lipocalin-like domain-containing protein [Rhizomicrobium sp.]
MPSAITLPDDQYAHAGAPTEWWWHIGTLKAGNRTFGFEINAASFSYVLTQFTEIMISDVAAQTHYRKNTVAALFNPFYAESNTELPWYVQIGGGVGANGAVQMHAPLGKIMPMSVVATFLDETTSTPCALNLVLDQEEGAAPLLVWGTGVHQNGPDNAPPLEKNNYYYSFTKLRANGTIQIGDEVLQVHGLTWMDHEYGAFGAGTKWILQDMQLDNGVHLSNFVTAAPPVEGQPMDSNVTVLWPDGRSVYLPSKLTPLAPTYTSPDGTVFCLTMKVEIPELDAKLTVETLVAEQTFVDTLYEGVAVAHGTFGGRPVKGTAWNEQALSAPKPPVQGALAWR